MPNNSVKTRKHVRSEETRNKIKREIQFEKKSELFHSLRTNPVKTNVGETLFTTERRDESSKLETGFASARITRFPINRLGSAIISNQASRERFHPARSTRGAKPRTVANRRRLAKNRGKPLSLAGNFRLTTGVSKDGPRGWSPVCRRWELAGNQWWRQTSSSGEFDFRDGRQSGNVWLTVPARDTFVG